MYAHHLDERMLLHPFFVSWANALELQSVKSTTVVCFILLPLHFAKRSFRPEH